MTPLPFPFSDRALSQRLERAEAQAGASFVEARSRLFPSSGACWIDVGGTYAMFDGPQSPVTQTFGLGMFQPPTSGDLNAIEDFFRSRQAPIFHEVSPLAGVEIAEILYGRGYRPVELTSILYRPLGPTLESSAPPGARVIARLARDGEQELWTRLAAEGWSELVELADFLTGMGHVGAYREGNALFFAEIDGVPIATGSVGLYGGVAHLAGAATIPSGRNRGAQLALLDARLRYAAGHGCDLATMGASPGSASQRNAERHGFRIAYTRTKWQLHA